MAAAVTRLIPPYSSYGRPESSGRHRLLWRFEGQDGARREKGKQPPRATSTAAAPLPGIGRPSRLPAARPGSAPSLRSLLRMSCIICSGR